MPETIRAYTQPEARVVEGFIPMSEPYLRIVGITAPDQTAWDERPAGQVRDEYIPPNGALLPHMASHQHMPPPPEAGEFLRVRTSTLEPENVTTEDKQLAEQAFTDVLALIPEDRAFTELTSRIVQGNQMADRPATYEEALYALELARFITAEDFQHRIACYELSLTAALFCHTKGLSVDWCLGMSLQAETPHAWLEAAGEPVRGPADEIIVGVYQRLLRVGSTVA